MEERLKTYKVADISLDSQGNWYVQFLGEQKSVSGPYFGPGTKRSTSLALLLNTVRVNLNKCKREILERIKDLETVKEEPQETPEE